MSKDLEKEYKALVNSETPDLWTRIEAGLDTKDNSRKRIQRIHYRVWGTVAAACLCVAVAVPVMMRGTLSSGSKTDMTATPEAAGESMDSYTITEGADIDGMSIKNADNSTMLSESMNEIDMAADCGVLEGALDGNGEIYHFTATVEILDIDVRRDSGPVYTAKVLDTENAELEKDSEIKIAADSGVLLEKSRTYEFTLYEEETGNEIVYRIAD